MSQLDSPPFGAPSDGPQKTSGLAIASFVCSLICCIPVTTVPAILLGIWAMISIGGDPSKKGKGLAVTGIILGVIFSVGQALTYPVAIGYMKTTYQLVTTGPDTALTAGFAGDTAGFRDGFHGDGAMATDAEAAMFIGQLRERYGEYVGCRLDEQSAGASQPPFGQPNVTFPYILEFTGGEVQAEAEVIFSDPARGGFVNKIGLIRIIDEDGGDLTYPADLEEALEEAIEDLPDLPADAPAGGDGG